MRGGETGGAGAPVRTRPVTCLVVAKAPVPGLAKTRLTPPLTPHQGAALAAAALLDTLDAVHAAGAGKVVVALTGDLEQASATAALRTSLARGTVLAQRGDGFAERLAHAHLDAAGEDGPVLQVGMDTPQLDPVLLRGLAARLVADDGPDALLGPAVDGGWWCLGLRRAGAARALREVEMSTGSTGRDTRTALERLGLRVEQVPVLQDVDELDDIAPVAAAAPGTRFAGLAGVLLAHREPVGAGPHPDGRPVPNPVRPADPGEASS